MVGKLNYYLGKKAFDEGRSSARYKEVDFCKDPSSICRGHYEDNETNAEIRWLMGMLYWINKVQSFKQDGWNYLVNLHNFVDGGMVDTVFMDDVSRIVTRGCHDEGSCGHPVSPVERKERFEKVMDYFKKAQLSGSSSVEEETVLLTVNPTHMPSKKLTMAPVVEQTNQPSLPPTDDPTTSTREPLSPSTSPITRLPFGIESSFPSAASGEEVESSTLTPAELAQRLNSENNYCATSSEEAKAKCATTLKTCNFGDPPCTMGLICYGNVVCSIIWSEVGKLESIEESSSEEIVVTEPESDSFSGSLSCNGMCLRPLSSNECLAGGEALASLPDCLGISIGGVCEDVGNRCMDGADTAYASNCPGGRHVFMRVFDEKCGQEGSIQNQTNHNNSSPTPTGFTPLSTKPSLSESHDNSNATFMDHSITNDTESEDASEGWGNEGLSGFQRDDDRPGAWWTWDATNNGPCRLCMGRPSLLITVIFILYIL